MPAIVTADIHLTDNPRDAHRWGLFAWLREQCRKYDAELLFLGDYTDAKDRHAGMLVNRVVEELYHTASVIPVHMIPGNHDYINPDMPFFRFLDLFGDGRQFRLNFYDQPTPAKLHIGPAWFIPSTTRPEQWQEDWKRIGRDFKYVFTHYSFDGAISETGHKLGGLPPSIFKDFPGKVYSGDVHMPQHVAKNIEYVGAPYRCHFGDQFTPRVLLIHNDGRQEDLHFPCKSKHLLPVRNAHEFDMVAEALKIKEGDQVKVRVPMKRRDYPRWAEVRAELRQAAENWKVELYGIEMVAVETLGGRDHTGEASGLSSHASPVELMKAYAEKRKLGGEMVQLGLELMMGVKSGGDANQSEHGKPALR